MSFINSIRNHIPFLSGKSSKVPSKEELEQNQKDIFKIAQDGEIEMTFKVFTGQKAAAGKKYMKKIKKTSLNEKSVILAKAAMDVGGGLPDPRVDSFKSAFDMIKAGVPMPIGAALSTLAMDSISWVALSYNKVSRTKHFLKEIVEHSKNKAEVALANAALSVGGSSPHDPRAEAFEAVFNKIKEGVQGPVSVALADTGLEAMKECFFPNEAEKIGKAFLKAIIKNTAKDSPAATIAKAALDSAKKDSAETMYAAAFIKIKGPKAVDEARKKALEQNKSDFLVDQFYEKQEGRTESQPQKKEYILMEDNTVVIGGVRLKKGVR